MRRKKQAGVRVATYITPELFMQLVKKAESVGSNPSAMIRQFIVMALKECKK